jgi:hypothetical protein
LLEGRVSASPTVEDHTPFAEACVTDEGPPVVELAGDVDSTTEYRVMRLLPVRGEVRGGSSRSVSLSG